MPYSTRNILGLVPPQLLLQFLSVGVLTLSDSVFEFPLYMFEFCPVPHPESLLLPAEREPSGHWLPSVGCLDKSRML